MTYGSLLPLVNSHDHALIEAHPFIYEADLESDIMGYFRRPYSPPNPHHGSGRSTSRLRDVDFQCERNLGWNMEYATAYVVNHLDPANSPGAAELLRKVRFWSDKISQSSSHMRDVAYQMFSFLDKILFNSQLKDAVFLDVQNLGYEVSGATYNPDKGPNPRVHRISIVLNAEMYHYKDADTILASLIHHMIHAYFLVACGPQQADEVAYGKLGHGLPFAKVLYTIRNLSGTEYKKPLPLRFGHKLNHSRGMPGFYVHPYHEADHQGRPGSDSWYCSYCAPGIEVVSESDANAWYDGLSKPLLNLPECAQKATVVVFKDNKLTELPRAKALPTGDSVEVIFDKQAIQVPREKMCCYPSVNAAFSESRWLEIPEATQKETVLALIEFLHTGTYAPDITPVTAPNRRGPPLIRPVQADSPPYLLTDIRLFKLATALKLDDVKNTALSRLHSQYITHEDPIAILHEIYDPNAPEPDPLLRAWTRKFLTQHPANSIDLIDSAILGTVLPPDATEGAEPPNLRKLESDFSFKPRFLDLREHSAAFHVDYMKARDHLHAQFPPVSPPVPPNTPGPLNYPHIPTISGIPGMIPSLFSVPGHGIPGVHTHAGLPNYLPPGLRGTRPEYLHPALAAGEALVAKGLYSSWEDWLRALGSSRGWGADDVWYN